MSRLCEWLGRRAELLGLSWPQGVADAGGMSADLLRAIEEKNSLAGIGRSARGYLARAMKVSVRELESLDAGRLAWIDDSRQVDFDRTAPEKPLEIPCIIETGVPIVGRIKEEGIVEHDERPAQDVSRLPVRYKGVPEAFALELVSSVGHYLAGRILVFQPVAPGELQAGEFALFTSAETEFRQIEQLVGGTIMIHDGQTQRHIALAEILRAARIIGQREKP